MIKKIIPKIFIALAVIVAAVLWLISGLNSGLDFGFNAFWPTVLASVGVAFLIGSFCYNSPGYLYFFGLFASIGGVFLFSYYGPEASAKLSYLWPLLIGCPGVASLIMFFVRRWSLMHLKFALFFLGLSAALFLANAGIVSWGIMVPLMIILVGLILLANVIFRGGRSWDMVEEDDAAYMPESDNGGDNEKSDSDD